VTRRAGDGDSPNVLPIEHAPNRGGQLKIIAVTLEQPVIEKILTPLGLPPLFFLARASLGQEKGV
jgi:hypothetical protein